MPKKKLIYSVPASTAQQMHNHRNLTQFLTQNHVIPLSLRKMRDQVASWTKINSRSAVTSLPHPQLPFTQLSFIFLRMNRSIQIIAQR